MFCEVDYGDGAGADVCDEGAIFIRGEGDHVADLCLGVDCV